MLNKGIQIEDINISLLLHAVADDIAIISNCAEHMQEILETVSRGGGALNSDYR